jgi:hypothetical protein
MLTRALLLGALGLAGGSVVGCAQERPPINQVQADALAKSFFVGADLKDISDDPEFYMRGTVVDVGYGAAQDGLFTSTYAQPVSRIRWEVTEDYLNARLSYERVSRSDGKGNQTDGLVKKKSNDGQIVAAYRIKSHFDIRRAYNPTTGEEQNVVVENASDRPWYQREYFRVDWSANLATDAYDYDTLSSLGWIGAIQYEPLSYTVLDPNDVDAPHFDAADGYFDVTNKAFAKPALIDLSSLGWGIDTIPACMLPGDFAGGTQPYGDCNPIEITLRQSFRKVVDKDYEPKDYDGFRFQAFGIFETERTGYARDYGMTDNQWHKFASRYNIWERSHYYDDPEAMTGQQACATKETTETPTGDPTADPNRDTDNNGTADECEFVAQATGFGGSRCDIFTKKCTLPYQARKVITTPWYINGGNTVTINALRDQIANATSAKTKKDLQAKLAEEIKKGEDLFEATNWAVQEWDLAMKTAVQTARLVECRKTGGDPATCKQSFPMWVGQQEDNEEAAELSRTLDVCRRKAALGSTDPTTNVDNEKLEAARKAGWNDAVCNQAVADAANKLAAERGNPADESAAAMAVIVPMAPVLVLCHNPVIASDHPSCGSLGLSPRLGDIRYNTVLNIDKPQQPSAWGIMVDADDPLTGEKVAASINIWTHITDIASQGLVDLVKYINGELKTADITEGTYITNWAKAAQLAADGTGPTMTKEQIHARLAAGTNLDAKSYANLTKNGLSPAIKAQVRQFHDEKVKDAAVSHEVASKSAYDSQARMKSVRGTPTEAKLLNPAMLQLAGIHGQIPSGAALDQASPMALNNPKVASQLRQMRENALAARGACILNEAPETSSLTGIAAALTRKFPKGAMETPEATQARWDGMLGYLRRRYHYAVIAHEMGHSVGLRHNFVSTYAALHFRPQYWQLRTKNGTVTKECTDADIDGKTCVGPRYYDPLTDEEQSQMIWMFMQSTVMDYPGDVSQDVIGLGAYDYAAARMFYGDVTSVYDVQQNGKLVAKYLASGQVGQGMLGTTDNFGGLVGIKYSLGTGNAATDIHYSQLQANYGLINNCKQVTPTQPAWWNEAKDGKWDPLMDGRIVTVDGKATKCRTLQVDYMGWDQLRMPTTAEGGSFFRGANAVDPVTKRIRVPYSFASDNWADTGNTSVFRHDNGADPYEQTMFLITTQENRHIFDNYRRGRNTFNVRAAADRSYSRYNEKLQGIAGGIGFLGNIYKDFATSQGYTYDTLWPFIVDINYRDNMIGATLAFDHFTRELSRPEAGEHYFLPPAFGDKSLRSAEDANGNAGTTFLAVPNGSTGYLKDIGFGGHLLENRLSDVNGDYDSEYAWTAGSYYDKINTAILLSESEDRFISQSRQDFYDARFRAVGMADVLPEGFRRVIANALTNDRALMGWHVRTLNDAGITPAVGLVDANDPKNPLAKKYPAEPLGFTNWWLANGPTWCFPKDGANVCTDFADDVNGTPPNFGAPQVKNPAHIDGQIGFEVQKFLIAWTLAYIPANQQSNWVDMMRIYRIGQNADPALDQRIEWQDPLSGEMFYARTYGKECLFGAVKSTDVTDLQKKTSCESNGHGHWVQKGIAARVLEYANDLTSKGYVMDPAFALTNGFNNKGRFMFLQQPDGSAMVKQDPALVTILPSGNFGPTKPDCDNNVDTACKALTKWDNHWAVELDNYKEVPNFLWEVVIKYGLGTPDQLGVYPN